MFDEDRASGLARPQRVPTLNHCIPLHRCIAAAGELLAGHFLRRLLRWHRYTRVRRDGHKWVTLTRAQWQVELDCSLKQLRRVLATMEARGFIERGQHRFAGKVSLFVRPTEALLRATTSTQGPTQAGPPGPTQASPPGPTLQTFRIKPREETKIASGPPAAAAPAPTKVETLEALWREARPSAPITKKMRGQFRHLVRTLRVGEAERMVRFALAHWPWVVRTAEKHHGAFKSPDVPQLGFLVKHIEAARSLMNKPPHPEEPHGVRRLEGWAAGTVLVPTLRDALLRSAPQGEVLLGARESTRAFHEHDRATGVARPRHSIMTYREMLVLEGASP